MLTSEASARGTTSINSEVASFTEEALAGLKHKKTDPTVLASYWTRVQGCGGLRGVHGVGLGAVQVVVPGNTTLRHPRPVCPRLTRSAGPSS